MKKMTRCLLVALCFVGFSFAVQAQDRKTVTGVVRDSDGGALIGATISEKGTNNRVLSSNEGRFSIRVLPSATLVISYIGYTQQEVPVSGQSTVNITLQGGKEDLTNVVVTSLGITKKQKALGYATATI